jgi:translation initiation factor IF-2
MRARGASVTDIVVLVVAADDGVMPQTQECISHAKVADVPVIVALNKTDLPDSNIEKVLGELAANEITPAEWGGDVEVVRTSALNGEGIDDLLETILLTAELHELKASDQRKAAGLCLEAFRDEGRGALAWLIVQTGTLRKGDVIVCGAAFGRVRAIYNDRDEAIESAGPSTPVRIAGLDRVPGAGDHFHVLGGLDEAREVAELRRERGRTEALVSSGRPRTMEEILEAAREGQAQDLALIIKGDTPGSIEALRGELGKFDHPEVRVQVLHHGVGGVNESDVMLAVASGAIIIAFHVVPDEKARLLAVAEGVEVRRYDVIYEVIDHIKLALEGLLAPEEVEVSTGRAVVLQTFHISRFGTIAGSRVLNGTITRNDRIRVIRDQKVLNDYPIASLRSVKDDVREVRRGMECGIRLDGFNDIKEGDELQSFRIDQVKRTLE